MGERESQQQFYNIVQNTMQNAYIIAAEAHFCHHCRYKGGRLVIQQLVLVTTSSYLEYGQFPLHVCDHVL